MKKVLTYISLFVFGAVLFSSCDLNKSPKFNDKDACVGFEKPSYSVNEKGKQIVIPVTLASVKGISTTISYEAVDGTAKNGVDYTLADETGTLTFSAEARTQYITINIIERDGVYTGDLRFSLNIKSTGDVAASAETTCTITIVDQDHPLAAILGEYNATGESYFNDSVQWNMELRKDAEDVSVVWFFNICNLGDFAVDKTMYYGVVNEDKTKITLKLPQDSEATLTNGNKIKLVAIFTEPKFGITDAPTTIEIDIKDGGKTLDFGTEYGLGAATDFEGGYYQDVIFPGIKAVKK